MKIIDLLNKIANGEEVPKTIKYDYDLYIYEEEFEDYYCEEKGYLMYKLIGEEDWKMSFALNIEIEVIEEDKKIKKLKHRKEDDILVNGKSLLDKIDEIIDKLNKEE